MFRKFAMALAVAFLLVTMPYVAEAYVGPGAGIGTIATIVLLIVAILLAIIGFAWYPIKRMLRRSAPMQGKVQEPD